MEGYPSIIVNLNFIIMAVFRFNEPLESFLLKHKLKRKFYRNAKKHYSEGYDLSIIVDISGGFHWDESEEGFDFWSDIDNVFLEERDS